MATRDATDTITGYFYQFDKTILEILNQSNLDMNVQVEGIEDIDIHEIDEIKAIQCKYYAKSEYNHSEIKKPITLMVEHFSKMKASSTFTHYHLYGHYKSGQEKLSEINLDLLKAKFLTYQKTKDDGKGGKIKVEKRVYDELGLDDTALQEFLDRLTIDVNAPSIDEQYANIIKKIEADLNVNALEAELYHYSSALKVIRDMAVQQEKTKRVITKRQLIEKIKAQDVIFDSWFIRRKGREDYIKSIKKQYLSSRLNAEPFDRFFLIDCSDYSKTADIKDAIYSIAKKWSKISKREKNCFCPSIYLHDLDADVFDSLKGEMYSEEQLFVDGYPFLGSELNPNHFYTMPSIVNGIKFKIVNSSEDLKIFIYDKDKTIELYEFYIESRIFESKTVKHTAIKIEDISYIKDMMK
jgi:hypothetical protein